jgi:hypothetical protein
MSTVGFGNERGLVNYLLQEVEKLKKDGGSGSVGRPYKELIIKLGDLVDNVPTVVEEYSNTLGATYTLESDGGNDYVLSLDKDVYEEDSNGIPRIKGYIKGETSSARAFQSYSHQGTLNRIFFNYIKLIGGQSGQPGVLEYGEVIEIRIYE